MKIKLSLRWLTFVSLFMLPLPLWAWTWTTCPGGGACKWASMPQDIYYDTNTITWQQAIVAAGSALAWENAVDTDYDVTLLYSQSSSGPALDYKNTVYHRNTQNDCGGCIGLALLWVLSNSPNTVRDVDVETNSNESWYVGTETCPSNKMDYWSVTLHEYGHMALCGHSSYSTAIMKSGFSPGEMRRVFTTDDENCLYYGQSIGAY